MRSHSRTLLHYIHCKMFIVSQILENVYCILNQLSTFGDIHI